MSRILQGATAGSSSDAAAFNARRQSTISQAYTQSEYSESEFGDQGTPFYSLATALLWSKEKTGGEDD